MALDFNSIKDTHSQEFKDSAIASDIADLNFRSFDGDNENALDEVFTLLIPEPNHNNNGTLSGKSPNTLANTLRSGGWIFEGHIGVSVKPNSPRKDADGKIVKYESPRGEGTLQLFIPRVSMRVADEIASKLGTSIERIESLAPEAEDPDFWDWFLSTDLPLIITEGAKKACSLVSAGYPAIALNGVWGWGNNVKDMFGEVEKDDRGKPLKTLHPDLEPFLDGREIVIAFDRDEALKTQQIVKAAKAAFIRATEDDDLTVTQLMWRSPKGIDDYIAAKGAKALDKAYAKRSIVKLPQPTKSEAAKNSRFTSSIESGLVQVNFDEDGTEKGNPESIGNHLTVTAYVNNPEQDGASLLLEFKTIHGHIRRWTMTRADLAGDGAAIIAGLLSRDYAFARKQKNLLLDYLHGLGSKVENTYTVTDSSGWVNKSFVLPHKTYGDENLKFRDVDPSPEAITEIKGTLQGWKDTVASRCAENSRLILALGNSFAAPLLPIVEIESGGFHLVGATSQGKTTILSVAASVTGVKDIPHWRTTTNGLESIATAFNHLCLPLDEIGQADPKDVGNIAYMLANGQGKARMTKNLTNRKPKIWQLMVLSSGEVGLGTYMAQANITQKGGQEVRLPDVPAVPTGSIYGCFETIHGADTAAQFVSALEAAVKAHHGTALDAFLSRLVTDVADSSFAGNLSKQVHLIAAQLSEGTIDSAIGRVAKRFALVQVSLGLAHKYGLLPFSIDQIDWAISTCFKAWIGERGGDGSIEIKNAIKRIEHLLVTNEFSDRVFTLPKNGDRPVRNLLAYRKVELGGQTEEFWVPTSVFDKEFCEGVNKSELVKELQRLNWLLPPRPDGKAIRIRKIKGEANYYYVFGKRENGGDTGDTGDTATSNPLCITVPMVSHQYHSPKTESDTGDTYKNSQNVGITSITGASRASDTSITDQNTLLVKVSTTVSPVSPVSPQKTQLGNSICENDVKVGDRVKDRETGKIGLLSKWYRDRSKATIETDDGISEWIPAKNLERVEVI
jgi:putative DNA primase/helicase